MKLIKYLTISLIAFAGVACDEIENKEIVEPFTKSELYYQNLRDYKASDHEISFGWFAQYGPDHSYAIRFSGLPDSLDICSLWGGLPELGSEMEKEMRFEQKVKGTKMVYVRFPIIGDCEVDEIRERWQDDNSEDDEEVIRMYARYMADVVFEYDLDGFDADFEPGGCDFDTRFTIFCNELTKYMGPYVDWTPEERLEFIRERYGDEVASKPGICDKMFLIDGPCSYIRGHGVDQYATWVICQSYGGGINPSGIPEEKIVWTSNMGDDWAGTNSILYKFANYEPAEGHKGGFGCFFMHRNYTITESNPDPYYHFRRCIQICNPAIHY